jgi:hypothetical protein
MSVYRCRYTDIMYGNGVYLRYIYRYSGRYIDYVLL